MTSFCVLLALYCIVRVSLASDCSWNVPNYGKVDLSPLSSSSSMITAVRSDSPGYTLYFTPCSNGITCELKTVTAIAMATQQGPSNIDNCNGVISKWDNGATSPYHEINEFGEHQVVFDYPVQENPSGAGCTEGRQGEFIYICDASVELYADVQFKQDQNSNPCYYHTSLRSKHACAQSGGSSDGDALNTSGISGGWVFVIVLLSVFVMYCLIGYVVNGVKRGEWKDVKGNLPQYHTFWMYLPRLVKTGCMVSWEYVYGKIGGKRAGTDTDGVYEQY